MIAILFNDDHYKSLYRLYFSGTTIQKLAWTPSCFSVNSAYASDELLTGRMHASIYFSHTMYFLGV